MARTEALLTLLFIGLLYCVGCGSPTSPSTREVRSNRVSSIVVVQPSDIDLPANRKHSPEVWCYVAPCPQLPEVN